MNEVKRPKKPLIFYYVIVMVVLLLINLLTVPWLAQRRVQEVDYGTFVQMAEDQDLGLVEVQETENQILFTNKDETAIYKTGMIPDPDLAQTLKDSGAQYSGEIIQQANPILSFFAELGAAHCHFCAAGPVDVQEADGTGRRSQCHELWQIQRQGVCQVLRGHQVLRCGRGGRGQGESLGNRGLSPQPQQV